MCHLDHTPGYVEETANSVHVVVSSGASGGDYERRSGRVIYPSGGG